MRQFLRKLYNFSSSWTGTIIIVLLVIFFVAQAFIIPSASMQNSLLIGDFLFAKKFSYGIAIPRIPFTNTPVFPDIFKNGHLVEGDRPERGDIVIFLNPVDNSQNYVKRCFAKGGDEVIYAHDAFYLHHAEGDEYIRANYDENQTISTRGQLWVKNPYMQKYPGIVYQDVSADESLLFQRLTISDNASPFILLSRIVSMGGDVGMKPIAADGLGEYNALPFNAFYAKIPQDEFFMIGDNRDNSQDSRFFGSVPYSLIIGKPWFIYFSWDSDKVPRWDRIGKFVSTLEVSEPIGKIRY